MKKPFAYSSNRIFDSVTIKGATLYRKPRVRSCKSCGKMSCLVRTTR